MLSQFKDIFGKPREGIHSHRVFDIAIVDVLATVAAGFALSRFSGYSFMLCTGGLMLASYPVHKLFGVKTKTTENPWLLVILALPPYPI